MVAYFSKPPGRHRGDASGESIAANVQGIDEGGPMNPFPFFDDQDPNHFASDSGSQMVQCLFGGPRRSCLSISGQPMGYF